MTAPLDGLCRDPSHAGVFTDFDGTLAEIVDDPDQARPVPGAVGVLTRLARRFAVVGVVSGRPVEFLRAHLGDTGARLAGLYGLETVEGGKVVEHPDAAPWRAAVDEAATRADSQLPSGVRVERKGLALTLHFRGRPDSEGPARAWAEAEAARSGLALAPGRMSYELRPPVRRDKGMVVSENAAELGAACFLGDDHGDLAAFDALDELAAGGAVTLRVAVRSDEMPAELETRADLVVDGPRGAVALLEDLAR